MSWNSLKLFKEEAQIKVNILTTAVLKNISCSHLYCIFVFSGLEGASQTCAAKVEEHRSPDDQNIGADEENARVWCS